MRENKLKIATIVPYAHYTFLGGVENYSSICYENWNTKYAVTEFPLIKEAVLKNFDINFKTPQVKVDYLLVGKKPDTKVWIGTYKKKKMQQIFENFDVVIMNVGEGPRKFIHHPKVVFVQHIDDYHYFSAKRANPLITLGITLNALFFQVGTIRNVYNKIQNAVFYEKSTIFPTTAKNIWFIPLAYKLEKEIKYYDHKKEGFVWIGRFHNYTKNIKALIKIANQNQDLTIYGHGQDYKMLNKMLLNQRQNKGSLSRDKLDQILISKRCLIITSNYEGFSYAAVEALSNGTPIILFNTFRAANFLAKSGAVFVIDPGDIKQFNSKMAWIRNLPESQYQVISKNAIAFAKKYLSKEVFWNNWNQVLKNFM